MRSCGSCVARQRKRTKIKKEQKPARKKKNCKNAYRTAVIRTSGERAAVEGVNAVLLVTEHVVRCAVWNLFLSQTLSKVLTQNSARWY